LQEKLLRFECFEPFIRLKRNVILRKAIEERIKRQVNSSPCWGASFNRGAEMAALFYYEISMSYYVYILQNETTGKMYTGQTSK